MHLQHPLHYETDRYIDPYTHHETILTQPVPRDTEYSIETPVHDLYETLHPAGHYDTDYYHERGHDTPVHHYDYDIPHHEMIHPDHHADHGFDAADYHSHVFGAQYQPIYTNVPTPWEAAHGHDHHDDHHDSHPSVMHHPDSHQAPHHDIHHDIHPTAVHHDVPHHEVAHPAIHDKLKALPAGARPQLDLM